MLTSIENTGASKHIADCCVSTEYLSSSTGRIMPYIFFDFSKNSTRSAVLIPWFVCVLGLISPKDFVNRMNEKMRKVYIG